MTEAQSLFIERKSEIEIYFDFLKLILIDNNISQINSDLQKILKANSFILLYNLIESSTSKAIEDIYLDLKVKSIEFKNLKEGIKKTIIKSIRKNVNSDKFECDSKMETIWNCFESTSIFQGNVDARNIKEIAREYGFSTNTNAELTKDGEKLKIMVILKNGIKEIYHIAIKMD